VPENPEDERLLLPSEVATLTLAAVRAAAAAWWHRVTTRPPGHQSRRQRRQAADDADFWGPYQDTTGELLAHDAYDDEDYNDSCISCGALVDHYLGCPDDPHPDYEAEAELQRGYDMGVVLSPPHGLKPRQPS
jgi:hypothetical protein